VYRLHQAGSASGDNGAGVQGFATLVPMFPQAGKGEQLAVLAVDVEGLLSRVAFLPFVKAGGRYQAAAAGDGGAEQGLFPHGFHAGIDQVPAYFDVFGPRRYQVPVQVGALREPSSRSTTVSIFFPGAML